MSETTSATPRVGIIGLGRVSKPHIEAWKANGVTSFAFADISADVVNATVEAYGGDGFTDPMELIQHGDVDIVCICSPPLFHKEQAIAAVEHGIATICEKPLAASLADARAIADAVERTGTLFTVGFCHRFRPEVEILRDMIEAGEVGQVLTFRNRFAGYGGRATKIWLSDRKIAGGGVLGTMSSHSIDLFRHLVGDAAEVHAFLGNQPTDHAPELEVEHTAVLTLQTSGGAIGIVDTSWFAPHHWALSVYGTKRTVHIDYEDGGLQVTELDGSSRKIDVAPMTSSLIALQNTHFLSCWRGESTPRASAHDGVETQKILETVYQRWRQDTR